ncbi:hypothetical protein B0O99DRAFT_263742 [Bisporella sp. PMI_857]|nr:hypothetical protein B0O99DRAFT_263742 [Bisporella sp. PMI_857]
MTPPSSDISIRWSMLLFLFGRRPGSQAYTYDIYILSHHTNMAEKRNYEFVDSDNPAKRQRQSRGTGRRQGLGKYGEVSRRANDLKKGLGACWRCRYLRKTCDGEGICHECQRNFGFWGLHPNLGCRRGELTVLADSLFPDYPIPPDPGFTKDYALPVSDLLSLAKINIKRLSAKGILKFGLYSYLLDLIEEDTNSDLFVSPAFMYLSASLQLCDVLTESQDIVPPMAPTSLIETMRSSILKVLQQLDMVMRKKSNHTETLNIMFTLCVITIGAEIRLECFTRARHNPNIVEALCHSVQTKWHDTIIALFSACKDLKASGDIKESIFEITNWKLEYGKSNCWEFL